MLDSLAKQGTRDFSARYRNTIGFYITEKGEKKTVLVTEVEDSRVHFMDALGSVGWANRTPEVNFEFIQLQRQWFNRPGRKLPVLLQRVPARQWRRGICNDNTSANSLGAAFSRVALDVGLVDELFNKTPDVHQVAKDYLSGKLKAMALNKYFALNQEHLYMFDAPVGNVKKSDTLVEISLTVPMVEQEVLDTIRRNNFDWIKLNGNN